MQLWRTTNRCRHVPAAAAAITRMMMIMMILAVMVVIVMIMVITAATAVFTSAIRSPSNLLAAACCAGWDGSRARRWVKLSKARCAHAKTHPETKAIENQCYCQSKLSARYFTHAHS